MPKACAGSTPPVAKIPAHLSLLDLLVLQFSYVVELLDGSGALKHFKVLICKEVLLGYGLKLPEKIGLVV